jgi:ParB-like chromosome segregation protein Spo0J
MNYELTVSHRSIDEIVPYVNNARKHSDEQIAQIAASIRAFGWTNPILVDGYNGVIAGHGRLLAAKKLGLSEVPVIELEHMSEDEKRAYVIADNQLALNAGWDPEMLSFELGELAAFGFDLSLTGFDDGELTAFLDGPLPGMASDPGDEAEAEEDPKQPVSRAGDVWLLGPHRLVCGVSGDFIAVDRAIESWQARSQEAAKLEANGRSYAEAKKDRGAKARRLALPSHRRDDEV